MLTLFCLAAASTTHAALVVPAGLHPGDMYYLAFVTKGTHNAKSENIDEYNTFVRKQAARPGAITEKYKSQYGIDFFAVGSTSTVDARDNVSIDDTLPIYLLDGVTQIANDSKPLWGGTLLYPILLDQYAQKSFVIVFTGTTPTGLSTAYPLGGPPPHQGKSTSGLSNHQDHRWSTFILTPTYIPLPFYALSGKITVPGVIPEPASLVAWLGLACLVGLGTDLRRRVRGMA